MPFSTTQTTARTFFNSTFFAVLGASSNPAKFGHQVFTWYLRHSLPVTPINPTTPSITTFDKQHSTIPSVLALPDPSMTGLSIITPAKVTLAALKEAKEVGIKAVWLQPGSWDDEVVKYLNSGVFDVVVGGTGGCGHGGWCILVDGKKAAGEAGKAML